MELDTQQPGNTQVTVSTISKRPFAINRHFRLLWLGQTISRFGSRATGLSFVAILVLHASSAQVGWLEAIAALPALLISLWAGVWIDHTRRRPTLILADMGRAILLLLVPLATIIGLLAMWQLYVIGALVATLTVFFDIAVEAFLPVLIGPEALLEGNSKLEASSELAEIVGPSLGGLLIQLITAPMTICLDALSFIASAVCISQIKVHEPQPLPDETQPGLWQMLTVGLQTLFQHPLLRATTIYSLLWNFCGGSFAALYGLYTLRVLHLSPAVFGLLVTAGGVGGFVGALIAQRLVVRSGIRTTLQWGTLLIGVMALLTPLATGPTVLTLGLLITGQLLGDIGIAIFQINEVSLRQQLIPQRLLGRANASIQFLIGGVFPLGTILAGIAGDALGIRTTLLIGASGMVLAWLCFLVLTRRATA